MLNKRKNLKIRYLSLIPAGIVLGLAFPKTGFAYLAWAAVTPLLCMVWDLRKRESFLAGWIYGTAFYATTLYWVDNSVRVYGHVPLFLSVPTVLLLALFLGFYVAIFSAVFTSVCSGTRYPAVLVAPVLWVTLDLARTYLFTGFPWASLGYTQFRVLPIIQISDITAVYGVTFLLLAANGGLADLILLSSRRRHNPLFPIFPTFAGLFFLGLILAGAYKYGTWRLEQSPASQANLKVAVVQGNVDQGLKWAPENQQMILTKYMGLTRSVLSEGADLVVWPESALPFVFDNDLPHTEALRAFVGSIETPLLTGAVVMAGEKEGRVRVANGAVLIDETGKTKDTYEKIHLVPFGEYVPLGLPVARLVTAIGDFEAGKEYTVFRWEGPAFSALVCYEIIFPELVRNFAAKGARTLITITNDAWFGRTAAPYQHFSMAVFRAVENRMPVIRAANTGISGFIDDRGRIIKATGIFHEDAFAETVTISGEKSFYTRYGNVFGYISIVAAVMMIMFKGEKKHGRDKGDSF